MYKNISSEETTQKASNTQYSQNLLGEGTSSIKPVNSKMKEDYMFEKIPHGYVLKRGFEPPESSNRVASLDCQFNQTIIDKYPTANFIYTDTVEGKYETDPSRIYTRETSKLKTDQTDIGRFNLEEKHGGRGNTIPIAVGGKDTHQLSQEEYRAFIKAQVNPLIELTKKGVPFVLPSCVPEQTQEHIKETDKAKVYKQISTVGGKGSGKYKQTRLKIIREELNELRIQGRSNVDNSDYIISEKWQEAARKGLEEQRRAYHEKGRGVAGLRNIIDSADKKESPPSLDAPIDLRTTRPEEQQHKMKSREELDRHTGEAGNASLRDVGTKFFHRSSGDSFDTKGQEKEELKRLNLESHINKIKVLAEGHQQETLINGIKNLSLGPQGKSSLAADKMKIQQMTSQGFQSQEDEKSQVANLRSGHSEEQASKLGKTTPYRTPDVESESKTLENSAPSSHELVRKLTKVIPKRTPGVELKKRTDTAESSQKLSSKKQPYKELLDVATGSRISSSSSSFYQTSKKIKLEEKEEEKTKKEKTQPMLWR